MSGLQTAVSQQANEAALEHVRLIAELATARATGDVLAKQNAILEQQLAWLTTLINQLQTERALFLDRLLQVQVPVPAVHYQSAQTVGRPKSDAEELAQVLSSFGQQAFEDAGDDAAKTFGVKHDAVGIVTPL